MSSDDADALLGEPSSSLLYPDPWQESVDADASGSSKLAGLGVLLNLLNSVTGPSLLLAPFAFYCSGAIGGVFVLLLAVALQMVSIYCLVVSAHLSGRASYRGLTSHFIGQGVLPRLADLVSFLFAVAVCLLHFTVARDLLPFVVAKWVGYEVSSFFLLPIFTLVLVVPVALLNRMALFFVPSIVSLICLLYLLGALIYAYSSSTMHPLPGPVELEPVQLFRWSYQLLEALAIFVFVLTPQLVFFPVVRSLQTGPLKRRLSLSLVCVAGAVAASLYVLIGVFGYLASASVGSVPLSNIALQLDMSVIGYQIAVVAMLINLVLNFGLFFLSARESLDSFIFGRSDSFVPVSDVDAASVNQVVNSPNKQLPLADERRKKILMIVRIVLESMFIFAACLLTALFVQEADLNSIAGIGGSSLCIVVCFILPAVFYWRAWAAPTCSLKQVVAIHGVSVVLILSGLGIGVSCTVAVLHGLKLV